MRQLLALLALTALAGRGAAAQARWTPEIGVKSGFVRVKPAGTSAADHSDAIDLPGVGYGSVFAVIPLWRRLAIEPSLGFNQLSLGVPQLPSLFLSATNVDLGLRIDGAITGHLFGAVGGKLFYAEAAGEHDTQFGVQAAAGYRISLSRGLVARIEAQAVATGRGYRHHLQPVNSYSALLGISARVAGAAGGPVATGAWAPEIGFAAGYSRIHLSGAGVTADVTTFASPGTAAGAGLPAPPTMFVVIPVWGRLALEPGFDVHRSHTNGTTSFTGTFSYRLDYAVARHWYAAAGPVVQVVKDSTNSTLGVSGVAVAWGGRFAVAGDVGGRVEIAYATFKERSGAPFATNAVAITFAATLPLQ